MSPPGTGFQGPSAAGARTHWLWRESASRSAALIHLRIVWASRPMPVVLHLGWREPDRARCERRSVLDSCPMQAATASGLPNECGVHQFAHGAFSDGILTHLGRREDV